MKFCVLLACLVACICRCSAYSPPQINSNSVYKTIIDEPECEEVKKLCAGVETKDILILECLYSLGPSSLNSLNHECQNIIWHHTHALMNNENVKAMLSPVCSVDLNFDCPSDDSSGSYLKCVINHKEELHSSDCITMVLRLKDVAFHDFRWVQTFLQQCTDDIQKRKCGRIDGDSLTQSVTIACLQNDINNLKETCRREVIILRLGTYILDTS